MIRTDEFRISRGPYAVDLDSLKVDTIEPRTGDPDYVVTVHQVRIGAVWFRRRRGVTIATLGMVWDSTRDAAPADAAEALARHTDGRYGGDWIARWDGTGYAAPSAQNPDLAAWHMSILRPALANYPAVPDRFDGWYYFETGRRS